ncbi:ATP-binding protein [Streptacidiphilus monticola]
MTLLIAATRRLAPGSVVEWSVPASAEAVGGIREAAGKQLAQWHLEPLSFSTELILSELLTNAIRHGGEPIRVRLIRSRNLVCEVYDASSTSPHLRYAESTDEGGRGLFIVAQLSARWGTRYTERGKVIWAELPRI